MAADGKRRFHYWDPTASSAWLVCQDDGTCHSMQKVLDNGQEKQGHWEAWAPAREGAAYAFVAEWVQEFRHCGKSSCFGAPNPEAKAVGLVAPNLPRPEDLASVAKTKPSSDVPLDVSAETADASIEEAEPSEIERLGEAEFLLEAMDMQIAVAEACGARLSLYVAPRVALAGAEVLATDGSWGPLMLNQVQDAPLSAPKPSDADAKIAGLVPTLWIGDAEDFLTEAEGRSEIILRVRRRDWRVDPWALALQREQSDGWMGPLPSTSGKSASVLPPKGPILWSIVASPPPPPPQFLRCSDRDLVIYELHIGSFTCEGTLKAAADKLEHVREIGCTAISVMPVHQDARRLCSSSNDLWGYDVLSFMAIDASYGSMADLVSFIEKAHRLGLAVFIDFVFNHFMWGAQVIYGPQLFLSQDTDWGPRPDFSRYEVRSAVLASAEQLMRLGVDGLRVDSTKSIRKMPSGGPDAFGASLLAELTTLCRRHGKLAIAEDLEDGDGVLQWGGLGFHLQWDMSLFCWIYDALVNPMDEFRDLGRVVTGLVGLAPGRAHALRGRVVFMESHDTAASDRYGRVPAAVHNGKSFIPESEAGEGGDAFQKAGAALPYPQEAAVVNSTFAVRRAALGLVLVMTAPGIPMLLQGQEVCDSRPFKWPNGPAMDWSRVDASSGQAAQWKQLCHDLIALRLSKASSPLPAGLGPALGPLQGDGVHAFHAHAGVLAYLRWAEAEDSREINYEQARLALVVLNCTNNLFGNYQLGVPPSRSWRLALSTVGPATVKADVDLQVQNQPNHGFPCSIDISLQGYSAVVLLQQS